MLNELAQKAHDMAVEKGWYDSDRSFPELIALCHSELSEALEVYREGNHPTLYWYPDGKDRLKPEGVPIEIADLLIRVLDMCGHYKIDIDDALALKMAYNAKRPYRHGGKVC